MARATQWPHGFGKPRDAGIGPVTGCGEGERSMVWDAKPIAPSNTPVGFGNSRHEVVNHGPTMGSLATGSQENALNSGTAVRCPQG